MKSLISYLNPVNWVKGVVVGAIDEAIDENITAEGAKKAVRQTVNWAIGLSDDKVDDERLRKIANGMVSLGKACGDLGQAIHPDGEEGRKVSEAEMMTLMSNLDFSVDSLLSEGGDKSVAKKIKAAVRKAVGWED